VLLGAGTVLDTETARVALLSGAEFIVSPTVNLDVIRLCRRYDKLVLPGALTPTEVLAAWEAGADIVKIFPSDLTGPSYLKSLAGPLPQVRMMPIFSEPGRSP
jgi:2-dehydro-3-deoxyphosphogluconate aldolase/(4S)-4-hydroxy-2-oxoglutarate aldolase